MARKKKYRMKKDLKISREDALYLIKCSEPQIKYILNKIINNTPAPKKAPNKYTELINKEFENLKLIYSNRTDKILKQAATTKITQIKSNNKHENLFKGILESMNIDYEFQKIFMNEKTYSVVDFHLSEYNVVCEIDGASHETEQSQIKDDERTRVLKTQNMIKDVLRFYNNDVEYNQSDVSESLDILLSNIQE